MNLVAMIMYCIVTDHSGIFNSVTLYMYTVSRARLVAKLQCPIDYDITDSELLTACMFNCWDCVI